MEINVRDLIRHDTEELEQVLTGRFTLVFDDNSKLETNAAETIYTSYIWDLFRIYPNAKILPEHHVHYHMTEVNFGSGTTINCYTRIFRSVIEAYKHQPGFSRDTLMQNIFQTNNNLYNHISIKTLPWQTSLNIIDFKEILDNELVKQVKANMDITPDGIDQAQKDVLKVIMTDPKLDNSVVAKGVRADILSKGQVAKCIGPCGYVTDIDSHIFPKPVLRGYAEGLRSFYDSIIESRSGAKSLQFSKNPLRQTEYFSRRLQLGTMNVQHIHHTDCGTTRYMPWMVRKEDLRNLLGKYYLDEETKTLKTIDKDSTHLIGKVIKMRSVFHCNHDDPYGVCSVCFGDLAYSVPEKFNIGHLCAVTLASPVSQSVLSVKHLDGSALVDGVVIKDEHKAYLKSAESGRSYKFNPSLAKLKPKLIINALDGESLSLIHDSENPREINIGRFTEMENIFIEHYDRPIGKNDDPNLVNRIRVPIEVAIKRRKASFTHDFLIYLKEYGWDYDRKGNFIFDLSNWDMNKVFLTIPLKHHNMADHSKEIENLIESRVKEKKDRLNSTLPSDLLMQLFELVNSKNNVNVSILEIVLYATMIVDDDTHDYSLPKERNKSQFSVSREMMSYRSISAAMAYMNHSKTLTDPVSFLSTNRPNHPFDAIVCGEYVEQMPADWKANSSTL